MPELILFRKYPPSSPPISSIFPLLYSTATGLGGLPLQETFRFQPFSLAPSYFFHILAKSFSLCHRTIHSGSLSLSPRSIQRQGLYLFTPVCPARSSPDISWAQPAPDSQSHYLARLLPQKKAAGIGPTEALHFCPMLQTKRTLTKDSVQSPLLTPRTKGWHVGMALSSDSHSAPSLTCLACCHGTF